MDTSASPRHDPRPVPSSNAVELDPVEDARLLADLEEAIAEGGPGRLWSEIRKEVLR